MNKARREFRFQDAKSDKFWAITLEGASHTVHFGRTGTTGQTKTKEHDSGAKALASYEKLIASKVKKGYAEVAAGDAPAEASDPAADPEPKKAAKKQAAKKKAAKKKAAKKTPPAAPETKTPEPAAAAVPEATGPEASLPNLGLPPWAWRLAPWRGLPPLERAAPKAFKRTSALKKVLKLERHWTKNMGLRGVPWGRHLPESMPREEAAFWFRVIVRVTPFNPPTAVAEELTEDAEDHVTRSDIEASVGVAEHGLTWPGGDGPEPLLRLLPALLPLSEAVAFICEHLRRASSWSGIFDACAAVGEHLLAYLSAEERAALVAAVTEGLSPESWPSPSVRSQGPAQWYLAGMLGCSEAIRELVAAWPDDRFSAEEYSSYYQRPLRVLVGLDDPAEVLAQVQRLKLWPNDPYEVQAWLAATGPAGLDWAAQGLVDQPSYWVENMLKVYLAGDVPELMGGVVALLGHTKASAKAANKWIEAHPASAARGLLRLATRGRGKQAESAWGSLRDLAAVHGDVVSQALALEEVSDEIRQRVAEEVFKEDSSPAVAAEDVPAELRAALENVAALPKSKKSALPVWLAPSSLKAPRIGGARLEPEAVATILRGIYESPTDGAASGAGVALLRQLREHTDAESLEAFAWDLYEAWERRGTPSPQKWVLNALGHLGGDATVARLTPLIRAWPGQSQHARAVHGLEVLRTIGSDAALGAIAGIAAKLKYRALKQRANDLMHDIASDRGLSTEALADRLVPECGLDAEGNRTFDYGPRSFRFLLSPELVPMVQSEAGKLLKTPPKPGKKDDAELAPAALTEWRAFKKQVKSTLDLQRTRLEQAMVAGRRWSLEDFRRFLAQHPLLRRVVPTLLWTDHGGADPVPFRVSEGGDLLDAAGSPADVKGPVGLLHPLHLDADARQRWQQVLDDHELLAPFPQLEREVFEATPEELAGSALSRGAGVTIRPTALRGVLAKLGWQRGEAQDAGIVSEHVKQFPSAQVTAVLQHEGISVDGYEFAESAPVEQVIFLAGLMGVGDCAWLPAGSGLGLRDVDPIVLSEVLRDLSLVAEAAGT